MEKIGDALEAESVAGGVAGLLLELADVKLGQSVAVGFDAAGGRQSLPGTVSWIAGEAEFTPTPIQTRDERADLVYAIKIRVPNDERRLKIGMPVDVELRPGR